MKRLREALLLGMIVLAPWAFGAVEAWAELCLYALIALVTILGLWSFGGTTHWSGICSPTSLVLGALILLACFQAIPLGPGVTAWLEPSTRASVALFPDEPERIGGDESGPVPLPAATLSIDADNTLQMAARLAGAWLLFLAISGPGADALARARFARLVVINAAVLALFAIIQSLTWNGCIYWVRPAPGSSAWSVGGPFLNHNHLAAYLNMGLGFALGSLLVDSQPAGLRQGYGKAGTVYAAAVIAAGVVASHSRSGFLGLIVAAVLLMHYSRKRGNTAWIALAVALVTAGLYLAILVPSSFGTRLATILDAGDEGYQTRLGVWQAAIRAWRARPIWGSGLGSFPIAVTPYLSGARVVFFARAENEYIDLLAEGGLWGLCLGLAFVVMIGWKARQVTCDRFGRSDGDQGFALGAAFGLTSLLVQSFGDFGLHVPAIGLTAMTLCGHVAAMGSANASSPRRPNDWRGRSLALIRQRQARRTGDPPLEQFASPLIAAAPRNTRAPHAAPRGITRSGALLASFGALTLAGVLVVHGVRDARVEYLLMRVGLPLPGAYLPTIGTNDGASWELEAWRDSLQAALRLRPNWAEGHARLGLVHLGLYRLMAREWLLEAGTNPDDSDVMADPLWLLGAAHSGRSQIEGTSPEGEITDFAPVHLHLVPAARSFLESRRISPFWALPHAELASLHFMLLGGDQASTYADRALRLAGGDGRITLVLAQVALEIGDVDLAARCWRETLVANSSFWSEIAEDAAAVLSPQQILNSVVPDGRGAIEFAGHLYSEPGQRAIHDEFLEVALHRLDHDRGLGDAERNFLQAEALAGLGRASQALRRMETALMLDPGQSRWREKYIDWLLASGRPDEAHAQALTGLALFPDSASFRAAVDRTATALARGSPGS